MTRQQEDSIMGWLIIMMIALFIGATCQAHENLKTHNAQQQETK